MSKFVRAIFASIIVVASLSLPCLAKSGEDINWCDVASYWDAPCESSLTYVDLFCGAGGLSKGLEMAGLHGVCGLDYFPEAGETYKRNFRHAYIDGDVSLPETKSNLYEVVRNTLKGRQLGLVVGGFPCQGFSMAGDRVVDDPRNSLYREMVAIVADLKPKFVVCENVKGLRSMLGGAVEKKIVEDFRAIGYEMNVALLCAADYYVPQMRERVIFIGNRIGKKNCHPKPILTPAKYLTVGQAIQDLMDRPESKEFNHVFTRHRPDMVARMSVLKEGEGVYPGYSESWRRCFWDKPSPTVKENHGGVIVHPKFPRVLTVRELARLQTFPDDFFFSGGKSKQLIQIGNAVPVNLGKAIGLAVRFSAGEIK